MSRLEDLVNNRAQDLTDSLLRVLRAVVTSGERQLVDPLLVELVRELQDHAETFEFATDCDQPGTLVSVRGYQDATAAAATVGCSPQWVRALCRGGHVAHQRIGSRGYLVDVADLRRHLRRGVA